MGAELLVLGGLPLSADVDEGQSPLADSCSSPRARRMGQPSARSSAELLAAGQPMEEVQDICVVGNPAVEHGLDVVFECGEAAGRATRRCCRERGQGQDGDAGGQGFVASRGVEGETNRAPSRALASRAGLEPAVTAGCRGRLTAWAGCRAWRGSWLRGWGRLKTGLWRAWGL